MSASAKATPNWLGKTLLLLGLSGLFWLSLGSPHPSLSQTESTSRGGHTPLQIVATTLQNNVQQIVLLDTASQTLATYHVEPISGRIELKSVRNVRLDLRMEEFNAQAPLPSELRMVQP